MIEARVPLPERIFVRENKETDWLAIVHESKREDGIAVIGDTVYVREDVALSERKAKHAAYVKVARAQQDRAVQTVRDAWTREGKRETERVKVFLAAVTKELSEKDARRVGYLYHSLVWGFDCK